jgi:hypothetical protein
MTFTEASELVAMLQVAWPNHAWNDQSGRVYHMGLDDLPGKSVMALVPTLIKTAKFAPTPAEIRALLVMPESDQWSAELPTGEQAWEEFTEQRRVIGSYVSATRKPRWSHPLIERTIRAFGYLDLCQCENGHIPTVRAQFVKHHNSYRSDAIAALKRGVPMMTAILPHGEQRKIAGLIVAELEAEVA